jgi:hypothetical protein
MPIPWVTASWKRTDAGLLVFDEKGAFGGHLHPCKNLCQGRFAGAVFAHQHIDPAAIDIEVHLVQSHRSWKDFGDLLSAKDDLVVMRLAHSDSPTSLPAQQV